MEMILEVVIGVMEVDKVVGEVANMVVNMKVDKVADMLVKIPDEDYWCDWQLVILMETMLDVVMGLMDIEVDKVANIMVNMEVDKVADEVTDMEIDWHVDWHGGKDNQDFIDVTLAICAQISKEASPGGKISNLCKWRHLVSNFLIIAIGVTWLPTF